MSAPAAPRFRFALLLIGYATLVALIVGVWWWYPPDRTISLARAAQEGRAQKAPELEGGVEWLNCGGPISLHKDLKGKIVILDFWTLCCINCIHTLPDLAKLEKKYAKELVVIGVHSPKFDNEKNSSSIRKAILRYEISHPVVNDAKMAIWESYGVSSWPTLALIDPEGNYQGQLSGEGHHDRLDTVIQILIKKHKEKKTLKEGAMRFDLARFREKGDTPLFFPGKILADEASKRLFIADSTHHRVVVTDFTGKKIDIIGAGTPGKTDGKFEQVLFDDPQGLAVAGDMLYIADRKNHCLRAADLKTRTVKTIAGTGQQDRSDRSYDENKASDTGLNSPWDLLLIGDQLYIAMAGHHQLWVMDIKKGTLSPYAGNGRENIKDGKLQYSEFAQPSGLTTDGKFIYVADSEVSAIRKVPLDPKGEVKTLVGQGLFAFGDVDGTDRDKVRIQHALGVIHHDGKLYVADTYNSKLKTLDPNTGECRTYLGGKDEVFNEPAGLSYAAGKLYVADTNAHRIRVVDLATKAVTTLELTGVEPPPPVKNE
jgi:thiol-disulfide isomerase/thioredoxin/outer membrane protein assembly factor BamB